MVKRFPLLAIACFLAAWALAAPARAQGKAVEAQARSLDKKAMDEDYLATDFAKAQEKLNQAIAKCGEKCGAPLRAQLRRDSGVVAVAQGSHEAAVAAFAEALRIAPGTQLDPDTRTKDVDAAWAEAKGKGGAAPTAAAGPTEAPSGDFTHDPFPAQQVRTPLPIYAEYGGSDAVSKVVVKYKGFGMPDWRQQELTKNGDKGWSTELPCAEVQEGEFQYYLQGFNESNDPVASGGSRKAPYRVQIQKDPVSGEPPHLPDHDSPKQCADATDCPPGFPGCNSGSDSSLKAEGESCEEGNECKSGTCHKGECTGEETAKNPNFRRVWIGVAGDIDIDFLPAVDNACGLSSKAAVINTAGYYCTTASGADFPSRTDIAVTNQLAAGGKPGKVSGGTAPGNSRVMLTIDYAINPHLLAGVRLGYVLNTYPGQAAKDEGKAFIPLHLEARLTYVIGKDGITVKGLKPYLGLAAGASAWDAEVDVPVTYGGKNYTRQAWNVNGPGFVTLTGGARYAFSPRAAVLLGPRLNFAFGGAGVFTSISPELGLAFGF